MILLRVSTTWASRPGHGTVFNDNRSMPRKFSNFRHVSPVRNDSSRDFSGLDSTRFGRERHDSTPRTFLPGTRIPQDIQGASRTARVVTSCFERQHGGYPGSAGCTSSLPTLTGSLTHARPLSFDKDLRWGGHRVACPRNAVDLWRWGLPTRNLQNLVGEAEEPLTSWPVQNGFSIRVVVPLQGVFQPPGIAVEE